MIRTNIKTWNIKREFIDFEGIGRAVYQGMKVLEVHSGEKVGVIIQASPSGQWIRVNAC